DVSLTVFFFFFFQAEDGIRDRNVTGVQTCALPMSYLGRTFDEKGAKIVLVPSLLIFALGLMVLGGTTVTITLLIAAGLIGLGYGTLLPGYQTLAIQRTIPNRSGHAISTFFILYDLGIAFGAFIWGIVIEVYGFQAMYFLGAILMFITAGLLYMQLTQHEKKESKEKKNKELQVEPVTSQD